MSKRSPEDVLEDIEDSAIDDELDRVLSMSPEERRRELEEAGYDMVELHAKADALYEKIQHASDPAEVPVPAPVPAPTPIAAARPRRTHWIAGLALAAALAALYAMSAVSLVGKGRTSKSAPELRHDAAEACGRAQWRECLTDLDNADRLDPAGTTDPRAKALRDKAETGLRAGQGK
jgi:hypothetical protein